MLPELPDRDTPEAVLLLVRLSRLVASGPAHRLQWLASRLNDRLPERSRIARGDIRLDKAVEYDGDVADYAAAAIGRYVLNADVDHVLFQRSKAFLVLSRYFTWCRGLWKSVELRRDAVDAFVYDYEAAPPSEDIGEQSMGGIFHWLASLCVVIEGWEELQLTDPEIDKALQAGGDTRTEGTLRHRLQRLRNGVFHFQLLGTEDDRFENFWRSNVAAWAIPLESEFDRFFRRAWETRNGSIEQWLFRGLDPRFDPVLGPQAYARVGSDFTPELV